MGGETRRRKQLIHPAARNVFNLLTKSRRGRSVDQTGDGMTSEDLAVFAAAEAAADEGREVVLATIVRCKGSTPRGIGSKMLVDPERGLTGTVGGGCGEAEVIEAAREVIATGQPRLLRIDLTEDLFSWSPAVCGGVFDVFLERVQPRAPHPPSPAGGA